MAAAADAPLWRTPRHACDGFGYVRAAHEIRTGHAVAIKIVGKQKMAEAGITGRIMNEVQIHSRLVHLAVVKLLHWFEYSSSVYLVM